jgi:hypothetical protein
MLYPVPRAGREDLTISVAVLLITLVLMVASFVIR